MRAVLTREVGRADAAGRMPMTREQALTAIVRAREAADRRRTSQEMAESILSSSRVAGAIGESKWHASLEEPLTRVLITLAATALEWLERGGGSDVQS